MCLESIVSHDTLLYAEINHSLSEGSNVFRKFFMKMRVKRDFKLAMKGKVWEAPLIPRLSNF